MIYLVSLIDMNRRSVRKCVFEQPENIPFFMPSGVESSYLGTLGAFMVTFPPFNLAAGFIFCFCTMLATISGWSGSFSSIFKKALASKNYSFADGFVGTFYVWLRLSCNELSMLILHLQADPSLVLAECPFTFDDLTC